ncbi:MAG TPA: GNAT family N-acetyltransferase [Solirubrobacteraceae bacterium]|nr:GNAT family N-acetyltransferase [Solirubrobacteraceae bacterium]
MSEGALDLVALQAPGDDDTAAILRALAARDAHDYGDPSFTRAEILARWQTGGFDPAADSVIAEHAGAIAGYAAVFNVGALAFVAREREGRGIGARLLAWTEQRETQRGAATHRQRVAHTNATAAALLGTAGYAHVRTVWQMASPLTSVVTPPSPPEGVTFEPIDRIRDAEAIHAADAAIFAKNPDYVAETFEDFRTEHLATAQFDPEASVVARRRGAVAGYALCQRLPGQIGYVDVLGVCEDERGLGLGAAIVGYALAAFARTGLREARLEVASDNPVAVRMYERAGLARRNGAAIWEKPLAG